MKKRVLFGLLGALLVFAFVACDQVTDANVSTDTIRPDGPRRLRDLEGTWTGSHAASLLTQVVEVSGGPVTQGDSDTTTKSVLSEWSYSLVIAPGAERNDPHTWTLTVRETLIDPGLRLASRNVTTGADPVTTDTSFSIGDAVNSVFNNGAQAVNRLNGLAAAGPRNFVSDRGYVNLAVAANPWVDDPGEVGNSLGYAPDDATKPVAVANLGNVLRQWVWEGTIEEWEHAESGNAGRQFGNHVNRGWTLVAADGTMTAVTGGFINTAAPASATAPAAVWNTETMSLGPEMLYIDSEASFSEVDGEYIFNKFVSGGADFGDIGGLRLAAE